MRSREAAPPERDIFEDDTETADFQLKLRHLNDLNRLVFHIQDYLAKFPIVKDGCSNDRNLHRNSGRKSKNSLENSLENSQENFLENLEFPGEFLIPWRTPWRHFFLLPSILLF